MKETFFKYNPWWDEKYKFNDLINRPEAMALIKENCFLKKGLLLSGLRRIGKTSILKLTIKYLLDVEKIKKENIFYISVDDYNLIDKSILEIIEEYRKIHKLSIDEKIYVFLDEITYKENFELQLKNLYDNENIKLFCSSSSASILRSKKSYLTGRFTTLEILPLSFEEYLDFKNIKILKRDSHLIDSYFEDYLFQGGIPEYVLNNDPIYLKDLIDDILYKDIVGHYGVRDASLLKDLFLLLMERAGKIVSINKIANILKISPDTSRRYIDMMQDTFLIYFISRHGKTNEKILAPKKLYACDNGIRCSFTGFRDKGSLFENYIFFNIKNKRPYYVYENEIELDFLTEDKTLIEVKYHDSLNDKQKKLFDSFKASKKIIIQDYKSFKQAFQ